MTKITNTQLNAYPIGQKGQKWVASEKAEWLAMQLIKRSYHDEVLSKLDNLDSSLLVEQYGALSIDPDRYPLLIATSRTWDQAKPTALITGGVHGYETSGVQGALRFLQSKAVQYTSRFNLIVAPCISPWGYETINRWNAFAVDPNRSFYANNDDANNSSEEASKLMEKVTSITREILVHIDLHETTDTDNSEFRPALCARDNVVHELWDIPDGFYLVGDTRNPVEAFQRHIIKAVRTVSHIAEADDDGRLIGEKIAQFGVINYATKELGLCTGFSDCEYGTTTEVYPDSPKVDDENCIQAQVAAICSGLDFCSNL
ncbi:MAG: hypothetical protein ACI8XV_003045 [Arenicella sp.]|jgi:hypothetical protein